MAINTAYATAAEYRARIKKTDTGDDTEINLSITSVCRVIDRLTGMTATGFQEDSGNVTRIFHPDPLAPDPTVLSIPPLVTLAAVKIDTDQDGSFSDETALDITQRTGDVLLWPTDATDGPEDQPYTELRTSPWGAYPDGWPRNLEVSVQGTWGWPGGVPATIKSACIELTGILRLETPRATNVVNEVGDVTSMSGEATRIVRDLYMSYRSAATGALF